jgi:signal transduction histidine kinase
MIMQAEQQKVLVIDDELGPRESLRILLKNTYEVICADSVSRGLQMLREKQPDAVIMDIRMPGTNGIEGLREIRQHDPYVSVIMLTGFGALETAQEAIRLGANEYMKKPFDTKEMMEVIKRNVQRSKLNRKRARTDRELQDLNRRLVEELAKKDRMASLGQASAELVHDLRNPLTVILGYVQILGEDLNKSTAHGAPGAENTGEYLDVIQNSVRRCKDLIEAWLSLARSDAQQTKPVSVGRIIDEVVRSLTPLAGARGSRIVYRNADEEQQVMANGVQLMRAFQNILSNALDSLPDTEGRVTVDCFVEGRHLVVRVVDNGCGIAPEQLPRICDPYFTTKPANKGTGLGLFITKRIIEDHQGEMKFESDRGKGTQVVVRFPIWTGSQPGA